MGMFDELTCEYPLSGNPLPDSISSFQTKSLSCELRHYTINDDGRLVDDEMVAVHVRTLEFYGSNIVGAYPGLYTRDGSDAVSVEYRAEFIDGKVSGIEQVEYTVSPALKYVTHQTWEVPTNDEIAQIKERRNESLIGRSVCVWWGGAAADGRVGKVIAETVNEWVVEIPNSGLEIMSRWKRDNCLFDSYEEGRLYKEKLKSDQQRLVDEYDAELDKKLKEKVTS